MALKTRELFDVAKAQIDRSIYVDEEIYQQELERVFGRAWLLIGHDSLVPNPNDFFLTYMGEDPVILTRDAKGKVHAFLNMCRHRGNRVARADDGNAKNFMCTYHGWTYSNDGKLVSVPGLQEAYYGELDVDKLGLVSVAQIDTYAGFVFATWDPQAPSLEDYLGDARWYLQAWFERREGGVELIGPDKWIGPFNWKLSGDNFSTGAAHVAISHRSAMLAQAKVSGRPMSSQASTVTVSPGSYSVSAADAHGFHMRSAPSWEELEPAIRGQTFNTTIGEYLVSIREEMEERLGTFRSRNLWPTVGTIFPNFSILWTSNTARIWMPRGPYQTEVWSFGVLDREAPQDVKDATRVDFLRRFGPSGIFEQDDMDNWGQSTRISSSVRARGVHPRPEHGPRP